MTTPTNGTHPSEQVDDRTGPRPSQAAGSTTTLAAGAGLAGTLLVWLLTRWLGRRRQPTTTERAVKSAKNLGGASLTQGRRIGEQVQKDARPAVDKAGGLVRDVASLGAAGAVVGAAKVLEAGSEVGSRVADGAVAASGSVADAAHDARKFGRKWTRRILFLVSLAAGFVAGSAAGRERYEQIVGAARSLTDRPEVQRAKAKTQDTVSGT
jgi:hypothetical protein